MTFGQYLLINLLLFLLFGIWANRAISRRLKPERVLSQLHDEVDRMVTEFNQTSEHNISLLEEQISQLRHVIGDGDVLLEEVREVMTSMETRRDELVHVLDRASSAQSERDERNASPAGEEGEVVQVSFGGRPVEREEEDVRASVLRMHRTGLALDIIASHTGMTVGEIELIVSLAEGGMR